MKKKDVINLIRYHIENNDYAFREEAYCIADSFQKSGDEEISSYIYALLSDKSTFIPQDMDINSEFLERVDVVNNPHSIKSALNMQPRDLAFALHYVFRLPVNLRDLLVSDPINLYAIRDEIAEFSRSPRGVIHRWCIV